MLTRCFIFNVLFQDSLCLVEACKERNIAMVDLLLRYNAQDNDSKALNIAVTNKEDLLIAKLLAIKVII